MLAYAERSSPSTSPASTVSVVACTRIVAALATDGTTNIAATTAASTPRRIPPLLRSQCSLSARSVGAICAMTARHAGRAASDRVVPAALLDRQPPQVGELGQREMAAEPAPARRLAAAERPRRLVLRGRAVDVADAELDLARDGHARVGVAGEDGRGQAVLRVVRDADRVVLGVGVDDRDDGTERLLGVQPHLRRDAGDDRRAQDVVAEVVAAGEHLRALAARVFDQL